MTTPPELELLVRRLVAERLKVWVLAGAGLFVVLLLALAYLLSQVHALRVSAVRLNEPVMVYNPAWKTVIDAVDPARFPGSHQDDVRKGTLIQQWPAHGGPQHIWQLRRPEGARYQASNAPSSLRVDPIPK